MNQILANEIDSIDQYSVLIGEPAIDRIREKAELLKDSHVVHVNSTHYGGGVAEMLPSITSIMNDLGIKTGWRVIKGDSDYFDVTKAMHNALQGGNITLTDETKNIYQRTVKENASRMHIENHDFVVIHDPQCLPLIQHYKKNGTWIWRSHVDLSSPNPSLIDYLKPMINCYDAAIFSLPSYKQDISIPQHFFKPAINPFTYKNSSLSEKKMKEVLASYDIPDDIPLVVQISRFDHWKDQLGVIKAAKLAQEQVDFRLILLGNAASDDPEGIKIYNSLLPHQSDKVRVSLLGDDPALISTLQKKATIVLQKSIREGFGLTVTEAMWKGIPVIGGNVGGIPCQIDDGINGYLVNSIEETAEKIVTLINNIDLRKKMGVMAKEKVRENFLIPRLVEQYLDLFISYTKSTMLKWFIVNV